MDRYDFDLKFDKQPEPVNEPLPQVPQEIIDQIRSSLD